MHMNQTKKKLQEGKVVYGVQLDFYAPTLVELLGSIGFDFIQLDCEHGTFNPEQVQSMIRACDGSNITPLARVSIRDAAFIQRILDSGIQGILAPHVVTKEDALELIRIIKHEPIGERGYMNASRATNFGQGANALSGKEYLDYADSQMLAIVMPENEEGLDNITDIMNLEHIDGAYIGAGDLSASMNFPSQEILKNRVYSAAEICISAGKWFGTGGAGTFFFPQHEKMRDYLSHGARFINIPFSTFLLHFGKDYLETSKSLRKSKE